MSGRKAGSVCPENSPDDSVWTDVSEICGSENRLFAVSVARMFADRLGSFQIVEHLCLLWLRIEFVWNGLSIGKGGCTGLGTDG